ncbi:MAG: DUF86 domain-containing protein [Nanoarchaeota archaeon]
MNERINDKIEQISKFLDELSEIKPDNFEEYETNIEKKAACERYCEKIIECVVDIAFLVFKERIVEKDKNVRIPEDDSEVFEILADKNIISKEMAKKLIEAKAMRNYLAHRYGEIDDKKIYSAVSEELNNDINKFLDFIEKAMKGSADKANGN